MRSQDSILGKSHDSSSNCVTKCYRAFRRCFSRWVLHIAVSNHYRLMFIAIFIDCCFSACKILFRKIRVLCCHPPYLYRYNVYASSHGLNYDFYLGLIKIPFNKEYINIKHVLIYLRENRSQLEKLDSYMHWLFPVDNSMGMRLGTKPEFNLCAKKVGIMQICNNFQDFRPAFFQAFQIILDLWGMAFCMQGTAISIQKTPEWTERLAYMSSQKDSFLHIMRVIRSLNCFGMSEYQEPLLNFLMNEVLVTKSMFAIADGDIIMWIKAIQNLTIQARVFETHNQILQDLYQKKKREETITNKSFSFSMKH